MKKTTLLLAAGAGVCLMAVPFDSQARSSFGFSINSGPAYYPAPYYVAPPPPPLPPPPPPVYYQPVYSYPVYHRPAPAFSFSYHGR